MAEDHPLMIYEGELAAKLAWNHQQAKIDDLVETLKELLATVENNWLDEHWDADEWACYDKYRDVIAKAKGETE